MMNKDRKEMFVRELENLSPTFVQEVLDFIRFLKNKTVKEHLETALLSESALRKDWLCPEEDEAWLDL